MPFSPLISKIRCHNPNRKRSGIANRNYLTYIATREGVDISDINNIDDLMKTSEILEKDLDENIVHKEASNENYMRYMAKRPRSHGLFGNIKTDDLNYVASLVADLTKEGKNIYRGIISLSEKDAEALGFTNKEKWQLFLNQVMPDIAKELGLSVSNFSWVAAFHAEKTHPHVHYEIWDNSNKIKTPYIHTSVQHRCRELLSKAMFDDEYEKTIKELVKLERKELNEIRNKSRQAITESIKDYMKSIDDLFVPGMKASKLPTRINSNEVKAISDELIVLLNVLPEKGSLDYAYVPAGVKKQVDNISNILLNRLDLKKELYSYLAAVEDGQKLLGKTRFEINKSKENAEKDIYKRIGNIILKQAKQLIEQYKIVENLENEALENYESEETHNKELPDELEFFDTEDLDNYFNEKDFNKNHSQLIDNEFEESLPDRFELISDNDFEFKRKVLQYFVGWNSNYKMAIKYLYDTKFQNFIKAHKLLSIEANKGNVLALYALGSLYEKGLGCNIDYNKAAKYYKESLKGFLQIEKIKSKAYIEYRIGKIYSEGKGTEQDYLNAAKWYQKAVESNHKYAQYSLGILYFNNKLPGDRKDNLYKALSLFKKSSENGNAFASYELAKIFEKGNEIDRDLKMSNYYYSLALDGFITMFNNREDDKLAYRIGRMFYDGKGTDQNLNMAFLYFEKAANLNNSYAQFTLAKMMLNQNLEFFNPDIALFWLNKSASQGNQFSQYALGKMYLYGKYVKKDEEKALYWLKMSAEQGNKYALKLLEERDKFFSVSLPGVAYGLIRTALNTISTQRNNISSINNDRKYRSKSKQARKEEMLKKRAPGKDADEF
jgi:TPR repeat protein